MTRTKGAKNISQDWVLERLTDVERLAQIGCTYHEIAYIIECSPQTVQKHFAEAINKGKAQLCGNIRKAQVRKGLEERNTQMLIWLGKQYLNQKEPRNDSSEGGAVILNTVYYADDSEADSGLYTASVSARDSEGTGQGL